MMRLIGQECKHSDVLSGLILIDRGLNLKAMKYYSILKEKYGDNSKVETPVPISNTEVKHFNADDSWASPQK
jgi:hypothetical protein